MTRLISILTSAARIATGLCFGVIIIAVILQLLGRSGVIPSVIWTEELTRFALLWLVAFGAGLGLRSGDLVNVDLVCEALPKRGPWILRLIAAAVTAVFGLMLVSPAWLYTSIGARQTAPALGIKMDWIHASSMVALLLLGVFAALRVVAMLTGDEDGLPHRGPEDF
ncbi:TRAP transporter small permease [Albirhodobacter sp. R86504]|uniref:TRAP transporter small permease n=1 Tax=Albirhodobacter sp. R86504 TaxID=3093848 RepID=UPI00366D3334